MNILDIIVIVILLVFIFSGYRKGLALTILNFFRTIISLYLANQLYPYVSKFLRENTSLYEFLKTSIIDNMGLSKLTQDIAFKNSGEFIKSLSVPDFIKNALIANNNSEYYKILKVDAIEDYISGYIANMCLNAISLVSVFFIVFAVMKVLVKVLNIVSRLPIIKSFNRLGGGLIGFLQGTIFIWFLIAIFVLLFSKSEYAYIFDMLKESAIAVHFYKTNLILNFITGIHI